MKFLALDISGTPRRWISQNDVITYHAKKQIAYELGDHVFKFRGGHNVDGLQSIIESKPIVAIQGKGFEIKRRGIVPVTNKTLFGRDRYTCAYCVRVLPHSQLSRDHIVPTSKGGDDTWMNLITSCKSCNISKGSKYLEDTGYHMHYKPYVPCYAEKIIIDNNYMLDEQHKYLVSLLPKHSRLLK